MSLREIFEKYRSSNRGIAPFKISKPTNASKKKSKPIYDEVMDELELYFSSKYIYARFLSPIHCIHDSRALSGIIFKRYKKKVRLSLNKVRLTRSKILKMIKTLSYRKGN